MFGTMKWMVAAVMLITGLCCGQSVAMATNQGSDTILSIDVDGNHSVEKEAVLAKIGSKVGMPLDRSQLSKDVRKLYKSGFFSDVRFTGSRKSNGIHLVCHVQEYPLIAKVRMEGNDEFKLKDLQMRMALKPGRIFSPSNQQSDRNLLRKGYLKKGYYQVAIEFVPTKKKDGRVDVLVRVKEGAVTHIKRIYLIGNRVFSDAVLKKAIASKQSNVMTWFSDRDVFDKKKFGADGQMLQQHYLNYGYMDMKIESRQIIISEDKTSFSLTFSIHEGAQYRVEKVDLQGDMVPDKKTLTDLIALEAGDIYSLTAMRKTIDAITQRVGDEGYAFASVTPLLQRNLDDHTVAISFDIEKGEEVYIERINISGNDKTEDNVVRRLLDQSEGSRYSGSQIDISKNNLNRAPFVKDVRVSFPKGSAADKVNMKVDVTEKKTGSFAAGVGFSQVEKVIITAKIAENNFLGKGYRVNLNGQVGKVTQNITSSFSDPNFLNTNISASVNGFKQKTNSFNTVTYQTDSAGFGLGFGIPLTHELTYGINYNFNSTNLSGVPTTSSIALRAQQGKLTIGEMTHSLTWDSRDRTMNATSGSLQSLSFSLAGVGGSSKFWTSTINSKWFFPFGEDSQFVLSPSIGANAIRGYSNKSIPLYRRVSLGGIGSLRGFEASGVSIRDPATGEALGGDKSATASVNLFFPLPYMQTSGIRGAVFMDAGTIWGSISVSDPALVAAPLNIHEPFALSHVRYAAGFGIEWLSPIGPIGLAWSYPLKTLPGDLQKTFEFALGGSF